MIDINSILMIVIAVIFASIVLIGSYKIATDK